MKKRFLFLFLFLGFACSIFSQTQLTYFDYQVPNVKYFYGGLVSIESQNYYIEINSESIRVTLIGNDSIQVLYELSDFPADDFPRGLPTRSGYKVDGIYLYEIFGKQIRKRNILTGSIEDVYLFPNDEIKYMNGMNIVDDIIHFTFWYEDSYGIYNITTQEFDFLPFYSYHTFRSQNIYYMKSDMNLAVFNAKDGTTTTLFENEHVQYFGNNSVLNGQKGMIFGRLGDGHTRFFNTDTTFILDCDFSLPISFFKNILESEDHYIAISEIGETIIEVKDKLTCETLLTETYPEGHEQDTHLAIFDSPAFGEDYILFALNYGHNFAPGQFMLYDKKAVTISVISEDYLRLIKHNSFYRVGDEVYFIGLPVGTDQESANLFSINLNTKTLKDNDPGYFFNPISFGASITDSTYLLTRNQEFQLSINKFYDFDFIQYIYTPDDTANGGIQNNRYLAIDNEKLIFKIQNNVYHADIYLNTVNKASFITEASEISNLTTHNGEFAGLVNFEDSTFHLRYDANTMELSTTPLDTYANHISSSFAFSKYIFGQFSIFQKIYFDIEIADFKPIPISDDIITIHKSNQHILFLTSNDLGYSLTSFIDDEFVTSELIYLDKPEIISKNTGEYFILEKVNGSSNKITILKSDGTIGDQIISEGKRLTVNQNSSENGPLSVFMFTQFGIDELEIIMHRYDKFHRFTIPFEGDSGYPITWYKAGNSVIVKPDINEPGIYICMLGKEPKKLELNDVDFTNYNLLFATQREEIISFMIDSDQHNLEIVQYDIENNSISKTSAETDELYYNMYGVNTSIQISPSQYYVTFPYEDLEGDSENSELFLFDSDNLTFELNSDLNQSYQYSNPHQFIESPTHLFFIARTQQDNSYQLYVKEKGLITSTKNESSTKSDLRITPNPASNFISIKSDAESISIFDSSGNHIKSLKKYKQNDQINISSLKQGLYFIETIQNDIIMHNQFIKI